MKSEYMQLEMVIVIVMCCIVFGINCVFLFSFSLIDLACLHFQIYEQNAEAEI